MSTRKRLAIVMLAIAVTLTSLTVIFAQVAGEDVGRNIMRIARQKKTGQDTTKPLPD